MIEIQCLLSSPAWSGGSNIRKYYSYFQPHVMYEDDKAHWRLREGGNEMTWQPKLPYQDCARTGSFWNVKRNGCAWAQGTVNVTEFQHHSLRPSADPLMNHSPGAGPRMWSLPMCVCCFTAGQPSVSELPSTMSAGVHFWNTSVKKSVSLLHSL
jgi:hypothetical protein